MNDNTNLFIVISVANLIATTTLLVCVVLLMLEIRKNKTGETKEPSKTKKKPKSFEFANVINRKNAVVGVVFCRNCGQEYDSTLFSCPNCKTHRN